MGPKSFEMRSSELPFVSNLHHESPTCLIRYFDDSPTVHVFHAHDHVPGVVQKGPVEGYNIGRVTVVHDVEFPDNLLPDGRLRFDVDDLR